MRFLACLFLAIIICAYIILLNVICSLLPIWLSVIVYVFGVALGIYLLTEVGRK